MAAQRTSKIHHLASKQDGALIHTMRVNLKSSTLRKWETDTTVCTPLCAILETNWRKQQRPHTGCREKRRQDMSSESLAAKQSWVRWESAGKGGSETGFLREMVLNQYALFTKRSKKERKP